MIQPQKIYFLLFSLLIGTGCLWVGRAAAQDSNGDAGPANSLFLPLIQQARAVQAAIDPRVLEDTADGQVGHFLVVLKAQAQLEAVTSAALDHTSQGQMVMDALRATAVESQAAVSAALTDLGATYQPYWVVNVLAVTGNRAVVEAMAARPDVLAIESNRAFRVPLEAPEVVEAASPDAPNAVEWNLTWVNVPSVWSLGVTGQNAVVGNADTGIQWNHPALQSRYRGWNGASADHNYSWWDAIHSDIDGNGNPCGFNLAAPCDDNGHGTHTTGTAVGSDSATNQIGVAPGAKWIGCRNMDAGVGRPSTYIECLQFFLAPTDLSGNNPDPSKRPDAVGNSYGCPTSELCTANSLLTAMNNLRAAGVFMAVSAGNSGSGCSTVTDPPAIYDSAITVGATAFQSNNIASYSSRGPVTVDGSGRAKPDLVAPGSSVRSSYPNNTYSTLSGTSMASPHVAGAVALLWSAFPTLRGNVDHTEFILKETALHLTTTQGCGGDSSTQVPNNVYGHGRIDVLAAYNYALAEINPPTNTGLLSPSTQAAVTSSAGDNNGFEVNPINAQADGGGAAQDVNSGSNTNSSCTANSKDKHRFADYNINLPATATVKGIEIRLDGWVDAVGSNAPKMCVQLSWDGGVTWTAAKQTPTLTTAEATYVLGGAVDTWGRTWSTANLANSSFRVRVNNVASGSGATARDFSLDWVAVRVTYQ